MPAYDDKAIVAPATSPGGAISLIRLSGADVFAVCDKIFRSPSGKKISEQDGYTILYGNITDEDGSVVDDVLISVFRAPHSYTGEDSVEISCHGSAYITGRIISLLISKGARAADAGEFTLRAFLNGKMDLSQAEAVADIIASHDRASHSVASTQMRGGYSSDLAALRDKLLRLASLLELELDFSEEDVEFADRSQLKSLAEELLSKISALASSFSLGNVVKRGVPVAIAGNPNAGKSTLLNCLLNEERAMVSEIAGTTRDVIEESICLNGVEFRFIDTAGIRDSDDRLERMGIERTFRSIAKASVVLYIWDISTCHDTTWLLREISELGLKPTQRLYIILNKCDAAADADIKAFENELSARLEYTVIPVSAKTGYNVHELTERLSASIDRDALFRGDTIVSNSRHYEALLHSEEALKLVISGIGSGISSDMLAENTRQALYYLGTITGEITTDEIIGEIFSKFCIGK